MLVISLRVPLFFKAKAVKTFGGAAPWIRQMREPDANNLAVVLGYLEIFKVRFWVGWGASAPLCRCMILHTARGHEAC